MQIEKGDYVLTDEITDEQHHNAAKILLGMGFSKGEYPDVRHFKNCKYFGVENNGNLYYSDNVRLFNRKISINDILATTPKHWDGKGEPEVGQLARVCNKQNYAVSESFKEFIGLNVEIINKFYYEDDLIVVIHNPKRGHKSISEFEKLLEPIKSEREIAVQEMLNIHYKSNSDKETMIALYNAGYRKVEVK